MNCFEEIELAARDLAEKLGLDGMADSTVFQDGFYTPWEEGIEEPLLIDVIREALRGAERRGQVVRTKKPT